MNQDMIGVRTDETAAGTARDDALDHTADCILDDCLFAMGQVVGTRATLDYEAVIWIRDRYRQKFLRALETFGDRWHADRHNVTGVAFMLGERAVRYAAGRPSIDLASAQRAAADVERYCQLHSKRHARAQGLDHSSTESPRIAGYWCIF